MQDLLRHQIVQRASRGYAGEGEVLGKRLELLYSDRTRHDCDSLHSGVLDAVIRTSRATPERAAAIVRPDFLPFGPSATELDHSGVCGEVRFGTTSSCRTADTARAGIPVDVD